MKSWAQEFVKAVQMVATSAMERLLLNVLIAKLHLNGMELNVFHSFVLQIAWIALGHPSMNANRAPTTFIFMKIKDASRNAILHWSKEWKMKSGIVILPATPTNIFIVTELVHIIVLPH